MALPIGPDTLRTLVVFARFPGDTTNLLIPACACSVYADYWPKSLGTGLPGWTQTFVQPVDTVSAGRSDDGTLSDWFFEQSQKRYCLGGEVYNHAYSGGLVITADSAASRYASQDIANREIIARVAADTDVNFSLYDGDSDDKVDQVFLIWRGPTAGRIAPGQPYWEAGTGFALLAYQVSSWPSPVTTHDGKQIRHSDGTTVIGAYHPIITAVNDAHEMCHRLTLNHADLMGQFSIMDPRKGGVSLAGAERVALRWVTADTIRIGVDTLALVGSDPIDGAGSCALIRVPLAFGSGYETNEFVFAEWRGGASFWDDSLSTMGYPLPACCGHNPQLPGSGLLIYQRQQAFDVGEAYAEWLLPESVLGRRQSGISQPFRGSQRLDNPDSVATTADLFQPDTGASYTPFSNPNSNFFHRRFSAPDSGAFWKTAYSGISITGITADVPENRPEVVMAQVEVKPAIDSLAFVSSADSTNWFVCPGGVTTSGPSPERTLPVRLRLFADGQPVRGVNAAHVKVARSVVASHDSIKWCPYPSGTGTPTFAWEALPDTNSTLSDSTGTLELTFTAWRGGGSGHADSDTTTAEDRNLELAVTPGRAAGGTGGYWLATSTVRDTIDVRSPDINADLIVNLTDFAIFSSVLGTTVYARGDFDFDRDVDLTDFAIWSAHFPQTPHRCQ